MVKSVLGISLVAILLAGSNVMLTAQQKSPKNKPAAFTQQPITGSFGGCGTANPFWSMVVNNAPIPEANGNWQLNNPPPANVHPGPYPTWATTFNRTADGKLCVWMIQTLEGPEEFTGIWKQRYVLSLNQNYGETITYWTMPAVNLLPLCGTAITLQ